MAECEAGLDSQVEVFVENPRTQKRELHSVKIMDVNGKDLTVKQMSAFEAGIDSFIDSNVEFPNANNCQLYSVPLMNIHGVDHKVHEVKTMMLQNQGIQNHQDYHLAFRQDSTGSVVNVDQLKNLTDYVLYLHDNDYIIIFVPAQRSQ